MTASHHDANTPAGTNAPGARLGQAREDLRLTREEVAARLHLATRQIQAIDEDNYAELPGATYVRGYLKSYALLVGLAPEPLLEAYARRIAKSATPDFSAIAPQKEITSQHHQVRFVTYVVVVIVIGLAVAWWQGRETQTPHPLLEAPVVDPATTGTGTTPPADASVAGAVMPPVPAAATGTPPPATAPAAVTPPPALPAVRVAPQAGSAPVVEPVPALSTGPNVRLVLVVDQESWIDIRDARQVKLVYETVASGRTVAVEGVAPVSVFLGNAAGVRLEYNGRSVDVARHRRGLVARFTLGETTAPAPTP